MEDMSEEEENEDGYLDALKYFQTTAEIPEDPYRQKIMAANTDRPDLLWHLSKSQIEVVRWCAARNHHTPPNCLRRLLGDVNGQIRLSAAQNPFTPASLEERVSAVGDDQIAATLIRWAFTVKQTF